jgi:hypothetical protein
MLRIRACLALLTSLQLVTVAALGASLLDPSFRLDPKIVGRVDAVALQSDGRILVAGIQTNGTRGEYFLRRLVPSGSIDTSFPSISGMISDLLTPERASDRLVRTLAIRTNNQVTLGISYYAAQSSQRVARTDWHTDFYTYSSNGIPLRKESFVGTLRAAIDSNDALILGGVDYSPEGAGINVTPVLFASDGTFQAPAWLSKSGGGYTWSLESFQIAKNGDLLLAGRLHDQSPFPGEIMVARLNRAGEELWRDSAAISRAYRATATSIFEAADGMLTLCDTSFPIRLFPDGRVDTNYFADLKFVSNYPDTKAWGLRNGQALVAGPFNKVGSVKALGITLLSTNGSAVPGFQAQTGIDSGEISGAVQQDDGRLLVFGTFLGFDGTRRPSLMRLHRENPADSPEPPNLSVSADENSVMTLSWPNTNLVIKVETTASLYPLTDWLPVSGTPTTTNGVTSFQIPIPAAFPPRFYRIRTEP